MSIIQRLDEENELGKVIEVDTSRVIIKVTSLDRIRKTRVGRLNIINGRPGEWLIGMVEKISRKAPTEVEEILEEEIEINNDEQDYIKLVLLGTFREVEGRRTNVFTRALLAVPDIEATCYALEGELLTDFMSVISTQGASTLNLKLGTYAMEENAICYLDANKLFQKHCALLGSTGSGKSYTVATMIEQIAELPNSDTITFDMHGEYATLNKCAQFKIAGPSDLLSDCNETIFLPYWLLNYEELLTLFLDRSDQNAPNQAMVFSKLISECKREYLREIGANDILENFTIDSPIPFEIRDIISKIEELNEQMVAGARGEKQGPYFGKFDRFIPRLKAKIEDKRYGFLFSANEENKHQSYLNALAYKLMGTGIAENINKGVKIIDFSEVPSDILPIIVGLVARIIFQIQFWGEKEKIHPILMICDEAHLYLPKKENTDSVEKKSLEIFERIAKEGRKYGVTLCVVSQRPSDVNKTILSQCNNFISMRLTNSDDQMVVKKLMPDSMGGLVESLPLLDTGEAIVVGDAVLLPTRIRVKMPNNKPNSRTIAFWDKWSNTETENDIDSAINNMINQSKNQIG